MYIGHQKGDNLNLWKGTQPRTNNLCDICFPWFPTELYTYIIQFIFSQQFHIYTQNTVYNPKVDQRLIFKLHEGTQFDNNASPH